MSDKLTNTFTAEWQAWHSAITDLVGGATQMWWYDQGWCAVEPHGTPPGRLPSDYADLGVRSVLDEHGARLELSRTAGDDRCVVVVVPMPGCSEAGLAAMARLWRKQLEAADELQRVTGENEALVLQVSDDFEELAFLRAVAGELELASGCYGMRNVMAKVIPRLRQTIKAEAIVVVSDGEGVGQPNGDVTFRDGSAEVDDASCREIIRHLAQPATMQTIVRNHIRDANDASRFPGVNELVLVPISKNDRLHGWVLALNRCRWEVGESHQYWQQTRLEFGTPEASVARTAATLLASHAQNVELFQQKEQLLTDMVRALVNAIEAKDEYTRGHSERVALFARRLAEEVGLDSEECDRVYLTGLLHDVGKIGVDDATLRKPDRLDDEEYEHIQRHPEGGWAILQGLEHLSFVLPGVLHHHEKYDGTGYPDALTGEMIPLDARILAIVDSYDAMTSDRPYRPGMPQSRAEFLLREGAGEYWDPQLMNMFFQIMPDIIGMRESFVPREQAIRRSFAL